MLENAALWSDEFFPMLYFTGRRINKELMCLYFILLITLSIFPKLKFWLKGTSSVMAQCSGSAGEAVSLFYGPTLPTQCEDLAKPGGMPFKVAACLLYYMHVNMAFALTLMPWSMHILSFLLYVYRIYGWL